MKRAQALIRSIQPQPERNSMHTAHLTKLDAVKLLVNKPVLRVRFSQRVHSNLNALSDSREAVVLPLGITFWAVFTILAALSAGGR
jgi:hypothetical protein